MTYRRGDVLLAFYPFAAGTGGSRRPVLVIQGDRYNLALGNTIVAQITSNLRHSGEPAHALIDVGTPEGAQSGLLHTSLVSCLNLVTLAEDRINRKIGILPRSLMSRVDACLKAALQLP